MRAPVFGKWATKLDCPFAMVFAAAKLVTKAKIDIEKPTAYCLATYQTACPFYSPKLRALGAQKLTFWYSLVTW